MKRPAENEPRHTLYLVTPLPGERSGVVGEYVGETDTFVALTFIGGPVRAFRWDEVVPVELPRHAEGDSSA